MNYHGSSEFPARSGIAGYWVKNGEVYDVTTSSHIRFIIENPNRFSLTDLDIRKAYEAAGEKYGTEGKAREQIIRAVAPQGWIRIRHYRRPDYWALQCDDTRRRKSEIMDFCNWAIENRLIAGNEEIHLLGYDDPNDYREYSFRDGGVQAFLDELNNGMTEKK